MKIVDGQVAVRSSLEIANNADNETGNDLDCPADSETRTLEHDLQVVNNVEMGYKEKFPDAPQVIKESCTDMFQSIRSCLSATDNLKNLIRKLDKLN